MRPAVGQWNPLTSIALNRSKVRLEDKKMKTMKLSDWNPQFKAEQFFKKIVGKVNRLPNK